MTDLALLAVSGGGLLCLMVLAWLLRQHRQLRDDYRRLDAQMQRIGDDVAGLCSAAVTIDQRVNTLASSHQQITGRVDALGRQAIATPPEKTESDQLGGYQLAIQKIKLGANEEELVKSCGLTRDEAQLLLRLHGDRR